MYVSKSLSPLPEQLKTKTSSFLNFFLSKTANACEVSMAGIIPSSLDKFKPHCMASLSVIEMNSPLLVLYRLACIGPTPSGKDIMIDAPSKIDDSQLNELGVKLNKK